MNTYAFQANKKPNQLIEVFVEAASSEVVLFGSSPGTPRGTPKRFERYYCKLHLQHT